MADECPYCLGPMPYNERIAYNGRCERCYADRSCYTMAPPMSPAALRAIVQMDMEDFLTTKQRKTRNDP
jgi:hypothetical protein